MDPLSITLGVISIATALKDIIEVGERIYDSFARVSDNLSHAKFLAHDINCTISQLKNVCAEHHDILRDDIGMRRALGDLLSKMHEFEMMTVPLIPVTGKGLRQRIAGWVHSKKIETKISELRNHVTRCHSEFTMFTVIRIEAKLENYHRTTTEGVQWIRRGMSIVESTAQNAMSFGNAQGALIRSPYSPVYRTPQTPYKDETERAMARIYLSCQIKSITKWFIKKAFAAFLDNVCAQPTQEPALKDFLCKMEGYSPVLQPLFGTAWMSLHRHTLILALQIRNSLEANDKEFCVPAFIQRVAFKLPSLSTSLHHLNMAEEANDIVNWAITTYKAMQSASPSTISPRLVYCLYSLSVLYDAAGNKKGAYHAMDEALMVSKYIQASLWNSEVPLAVRVQNSEIMTGYVSILARQRGDYAGARSMASLAVENMENILDISPFCLSHQVVDDYVQPIPSFLHQLREKSGDSQQPIFVYAQALRVRACFYGSKNATAGSLGDTLRALVIFQYMYTSHGSVALPPLADTLYGAISHPDKSHIPLRQLLVYADACIAFYQGRIKDNFTRSKSLLGALQIKAEILHSLPGGDDEMLETWRHYVNAAQTLLAGDAFANALQTLATSLRKLRMFSQSTSIQTQSVHIFEIMNRASVHAQAKWHFNLFLDFFSAGSFSEAARAAGRSVEKYRALERTDSGAWSASLARGLSALGLCLSFTGDHINAQLMCVEAAEIFHQYPNQLRVKKMHGRACEINALVSKRKRQNPSL